MTKPYDTTEKDHSHSRKTRLDTVEEPADDPQARPTADLDVGLAERRIPEDS